MYDPELRAVKWFVVRNGNTEVDTALVYFIDKTPDTAWAIHQSPDTGSGYDSVSSALVKQASGGYKIYTGDAVGVVWKLEQITKSDNDLGYPSIIRTSNLNFDDSRTSKRYDATHISMKPVGDYDLTIQVDFDGGIDSYATSLNMAGGNFILGTSTLPGVLGGGNLIEGSFDIGYVGKRISYQLSNSTAGQDFFLSQILIDFKPVGLRP
jgi:hypothetical protein